VIPAHTSAGRPRVQFHLNRCFLARKLLSGTAGEAAPRLERSACGQEIGAAGRSKFRWLWAVRRFGSIRYGHSKYSENACCDHFPGSRGIRSGGDEKRLRRPNLIRNPQGVDFVKWLLLREINSLFFVGLTHGHAALCPQRGMKTRASRLTGIPNRLGSISI
jgi:hypothetical protein